MKFSLIFVVCLCAFAVAQDADSSSAAPEVNEEGIFKIPENFGKLVKKGLKQLAKEVEKTVLSKTKDLLTDGLKLNPSKPVQNALDNEPSSEGIFDTAINLVLKQARQLATEHEAEAGLSNEGIVANFGHIHKIVEAEELLHIKYNKTLKGDSPSQEGIFENLGGLVMKGLGSLIGGDIGGAITTAGDLIGYLFFAAPPRASQEGIIQEPSQEGIISSAGKILVRGAGKLAGSLLKGAFSSFGGILGNVYLARGNFNGYANLQAPANAIIAEARKRIQPHNIPEMQVCIDAAEHNFTLLLNQYNNDGQGCVNIGQKNAKYILSKVQDIVLDAVKRVEDAHRETGNCFDKDAVDDRVVCLDTEVPAQIEEHRKKVLQYGDDLAKYVRRFSDINTEFDVCLVGYLGVVRREVFDIVETCRLCVANQELNQDQEKNL